MKLYFIIIEGVNCINGKTKNHFILRAHVLSWSGDTPGLTKLMGLTGHNSYKGCRYCNIKGLYLNHIYYPTTSPIGFNSRNYDANNLPLRSHKEYEKMIQNLKHVTTKQAIESLQQHYGMLFY